MKRTVLIVEDELAISQVLRAYLQKAGFATIQVYDGAEALRVFFAQHPDLVLLDVMLPERSGWEVLAEIRKKSTCPVIMLTALGDVQYRIDGLGKGADDYIPKPFEAEEVVARTEAVLRRYSGSEARQAVKQFGHLKVDTAAHRVMLGDEEISLTPRDLSLLLFLVEHPNQTFTRDQLLEHVWGWEYEGSDRAVDLSIKRIRRALADWPASEGEIRTIRGLGYQLSCL